MAVPGGEVGERLAWLCWVELNHLVLVGALPGRLDGAVIGLGDATTIHDLNGAELFVRIPLRGRGDQRRAGHVDVAAHPALGHPLVAVSLDGWWNEERLRREGTRAAHARGLDGIEDAESRFVAYSFPKVGLQWLRDDEEIALLELGTWEPVPPSTRDERYEPPGDFERWSYLEELPEDHRDGREASFSQRVERWQRGIPDDPGDLERIDLDAFRDLLDLDLRRVAHFRTRELHYSSRDSDHEVCFELRGQQTNVWCVAASVQMLLDFYRYEYSQVRLAQDLGLGTLSNPNGLPYSRDSDVVTVIEDLTCGALDAAMDTTPTFSQFVAEIDANRPLVSFIPGHSRAVAGYYRSFLTILGQPPFRGLLVYDPWPPNAGVVTRWENYDVMTYRRTFTARPCTA